MRTFALATVFLTVLGLAEASACSVVRFRFPTFGSNTATDMQVTSGKSVSHPGPDRRAIHLFGDCGECAGAQRHGALRWGLRRRLPIQAGLQRLGFLRLHGHRHRTERIRNIDNPGGCRRPVTRAPGLAMRTLNALAGIACGVCLSALMADTAASQPVDLPAGYWRIEQSRPVLETIGRIRLAPDLDGLSAGERVAVAKLLEVGEIFEALYQQQRHAQAREAFAALQALDRRLGSPEATGNLLTLYRQSSGPITRTLEGKREAFLPVDPLEPGRNVYPRGVTRQEIEDWRQAHPEEADAILAPRTVVRRAQVENLRRDLGRLAAYPVLDRLHPGLKPALESKLARADRNGLYAVPYAVAYADEMVRSRRLMNEAADAVETSDTDFAIFLRNRSRDLLSNDYEVRRRRLGYRPLPESLRRNRRV